MIHYGNTQPNPLESKVWLQANGQLKTYNSHTKQWGNVTSSSVPEEPTSQYEFVDLGLPSGTLWATTNLGATKPEEPGLYFAWGETDGYTAEDVAAGKKTFEVDNYKFGMPDNNYSKYNAIDGLTTLELVDDAAYYMSDGLCKIPSEENWKELIENTTINTDILNGVNGSRITSTINGNSIFIPFGGHFIYNENGGVNEFSFSRTNDIEKQPQGFPYGEYGAAKTIVTDTSNISNTFAFPRVAGIPIRPVKS